MPESAVGFNDRDRNLLFAVLALQNELVPKTELLAGMNAWGFEKHHALGEVLVERRAMSPADRQLIDVLIDRQIERHGSAGQSLAALGASENACQTLSGASADDPASFGTWPRPTNEQPTASYFDRSPEAGMRYRILRPHARGGLGEVFLAEDLELHRQVALKEMQSQHADSESSRGRFVLEAEVTGGLEHPGIVPVYGLGVRADGRPYYAMRFIAGDTLKAAIERFHALPRPSFESGECRQLLRRLIDVSNAVAYAHSRGVLHRDLKPSNIMLGKFGETLLVDWGLAKVTGRQGMPSEQGEESTLLPAAHFSKEETAQGAVIGTPAFMSPEQAGGKSTQLGPAADVYSLGACLYTLLTNRPPFTGDVFEVLGGVLRGDWVPPRQVNAAVPLPLAAVCQKAMALDAQSRYPSAQAFAEDLEHWLADEPVSATRDPVPVRLARWGRKHRALVSSAGVLLIAIVVGLSAALWLLNQEQEKTSSALQRVTEEKLRTQEALNSAVAARRSTREAMRGLVDDLVGEMLGRLSNVDSAQNAFLTNIAERFEKYASTADNSEDGRAALVEGYITIGILRRRLGQQNLAADAYRRATVVAAKLADEFPENPLYRRSVATLHHNLGNLHRDRGADDEAAAEYQAAIAEIEGRDDSARAIDLLCEYHQSFGGLLMHQRQFRAAEDHFRAGLQLRESSKAAPDDANAKDGLAAAKHNLGMSLAARKQTKSAEAAYRDAAETWRQLGSSPKYRQRRALALNNLANLLGDQRRWSEVEAPAVESMEVRKQLAEEFPSMPEYRADFAAACYNYASDLREQGKLDQADGPQREAVRQWDRLVLKYPHVAEYRRLCASARHNLGLLLELRGNIQDAYANYQSALRDRLQLVREFASNSSDRVESARSAIALAEVDIILEKHDEALSLASIALKMVERLRLRDRSVRERAVGALAARARAQAALGRHVLAIAEWEAAAEVERQAPWRNPGGMPLSDGRHVVDWALALAHRRRGQEAAELQARSGFYGLTQPALIDRARVLAIAAGQGTDSKLRERWATDSLGLLRQAKVSGAFRDGQKAKVILDHRDFVSLRNRAEFQRLMEP